MSNFVTRSFHNFFAGFLLLLALWSCSEQKKTFMNAPTGSANEVIVVIPKYQWDGPIGEALRTSVGYDMPTFFQAEPVLTLVNIPEDAFNGVFHAHRNIIFCKVSAQFPKPGIQMQRDVWSSTQLILTFQAPTDSAMVQLIKNNGNNIVDRILAAERQRATEILSREFDKRLYDTLLKKHEIILHASRGFAIQKDSAGFVWIEQPKGDNILGLFIWSYPYTDTAQFSLKSLLKKRDAELRANVPGGPPGSYMTTERQIPPEFRQMVAGNRYYAEVMGHWTLEKGFMGGPFVNLSTIDTKRNRIVTVEGWVYAPNQKKRNWLRQVEAIAYTVSFPE